MKVSFLTLGCKVNQYESEAIAEKLAASGVETVPFGERADATVINTCAVTTEGERKARQMVRRALAVSPDAYVVVTGCAAQLHPESFTAIDGVRCVLGNGEKKMAADMILAYFEKLAAEKNPAPRSQTKTKSSYEAEQTSSLDAEPIFPCEKEQAPTYGDKGILCPEESFDLTAFEPMQVNKSERTRAYIKIEDGCDSHCAYCIIRKARGAVRSKPVADVIREAKGLVAQGYRELVLTGIEISAYGKDLGCDLATLLEMLDQTDGICRLRLGSLDPAILRPAFVERLAKLKCLCHHFHLSLQSGCSKTLAAMRRRNNAESAKECVANIRRLMPDATFTADVIVGFPGETEEDFLTTQAYLKELKLLDCHIFAFSPRPGTEAAEMPEQVSASVKDDREKRLFVTCREAQKEVLSGFVGQTAEVLFEENKDGFAIGHTANFLEVAVTTEKELHNTLVRVTLTASEDSRLIGQMAE